MKLTGYRVQCEQRRCSAFTLIELLIVVAIIAILAAIAVPNFLEAQTRAKVSRSQADMRAIATAVEMYAIDHNRTPSSHTGYPGALDPRGGPSLLFPQLPGTRWNSYRMRRLTTPVAYISTVLRDVFAEKGASKDVNGVVGAYDTFDYVDQYMHSDYPTPVNNAWAGVSSGGTYRIASAGPDKIQAYGGATVQSDINVNRAGVDYDASNGTISSGDIVRVSGAGKLVPGSLPAIDRVRNVYNVPGL